MIPIAPRRCINPQPPWGTRSNPSRIARFCVLIPSWFRHGAYSYQIVRAGDRSIYTVTDGQQTLTVPIAWAFGLGSAGQTYVYQWNGHWYESSISYFRELHGADVTLGFRSRSPRNLEEAAGRIMTVPETRDCFNCHSTNAVHQGRLQFEGMTPGVQCQRCHGETACT